MKKKVMVGLVSVVVAVALVFGGVTFYNNRQQEKFEKQMASYESVDTMQHPSEATTSIWDSSTAWQETEGNDEEKQQKKKHKNPEA